MAGFAGGAATARAFYFRQLPLKNWHGYGFGSRRETGHADHPTDAGEQTHQIGAAIADKRQRQSFIGQAAGHHAEVDERLQANAENDTDDQQLAKGIVGPPGNDNAGDQQARKSTTTRVDPTKPSSSPIKDMMKSVSCSATKPYLWLPRPGEVPQKPPAANDRTECHTCHTLR